MLSNMMFSQALLIDETFLADWTFVPFGVEMPLPMISQICTIMECLTTEFTNKWPHVVMDVAMLIKNSQFSKLHAAHVALELLGSVYFDFWLSHMNKLNMLAQFVLKNKLLFTLIALKFIAMYFCLMIIIFLDGVKLLLANLAEQVASFVAT